MILQMLWVIYLAPHPCPPYLRSMYLTILTDANDEDTKGADREMLAITDTSSSVNKSSHTKLNAEGKLYLQKSKNLLPAAYHPS